MTLASDLSGGVGYVRFSVDASGIQVDGDPIRFDNLVYLTSTINIIQVSTLVDTDIFAQRGFFSTLSSGIHYGQQNFLSSIVCNDISGNNASFDTLFVSTLEALDISGVAASNWSQYPTLASSVIFQPAYILSNVGNRLYFAGQELTDLSGGGVDWSYFPALTDVSMNNFSLRGLSTLQYQDGAKLYSQTGNNLFYNGQPVQYGAASNVSQWANFPAVSNVNMNGSNLSNAALIAGSNLTLSGSNITNGNTFTNSLGVGGTSLLSLASINSLGQLSCQDIEVSNPAVGLADVNIYGATAVPGDNALYVQGGVQFDGGTVHGFSAGLLPVAGVNTGRFDMLQAGFSVLHPLVGAITTGAALSITSGGATSIAAGGYVEMNTSTLQMINTSQGNKNTTIQAGFLTVDPDLAPTSSIKLFNTLGGGVEIDGGGQGSLQGFSTVRATNLSSINNISQSSITTTGLVNFSQVSSFLMGFGLILSTTVSDLRANNIKVADDITGITNAPMPLQSRIINFSSINSFNVSTTDLWVSSINGQPVDLSGGGGGPTISTFANLTGSNFSVSTINQIGGGSIKINGTLGFATPNSIENVLNINTDQSLNVNVFADRFGVAAFNTVIGSLSTQKTSANSIKLSTLEGATGVVDVSGGMFVADTIELPLATGGINFDDGSGTNYTRLMRRDVANNNMLAVVNNTTEPAPEQINMMPLGVGELWLTGSSDQYQACRLYSVFPFGNYELDAIDADGATLFAYMQGYENGLGLNPGFLQAYSNVSSISGYDQESAANQMLHVINGLTTSNLVISSINGAAYPPSGSGGSSQFSTLFVSSLNFSSATSYTSNTAFNYPIFIEHDAAGATSGSGAAIAVSGHNYATGAVIQQIEMGWRVSGENYLMAVWPGHNLEDLNIESAQLQITNGTLSSFMNYAGHALQTSSDILVGTTQVAPASISTLNLNVSTINGLDARPAFTNNLMLSTMELYATSTTLMYWDSASPSSNINSSGYDIVVGVDGTYKIGTSYQFVSGGSASEVEFFLLKNDTVISRSGGIVEVQNNQEIVQYAEVLETCVNGDKIQAGCFTSGTGVYVSTINGNVIQSPAVILTMYRVDNA
jgi:hypothetical protein